MAWGGASGGFGGPSAVSSSAAAGLPFAGVPPELADRVEAILETEPEHPRAHVPFTQVEETTAPFTLRRFLATRTPAMTGAFALVLVETLTMQAGPLLTQRAIDKGILAKSTQVLVVTCSALRDQRHHQHDRERLPGRVDRQGRRVAALRPSSARLRTPATAVHGLLHRRESGSSDDPHDERHRSAEPAVPGRHREPRGPSAHDGDRHGDPVPAQPRAGRDHRAPGGSDDDDRDGLVPTGIGPRLHACSGAHRRGPRGPAGEPLRHPHHLCAQPSPPQRAAAPQHRRRVPRREPVHRASERRLRPGDRSDRRRRPGGHLARRRQHGAATERSRSVSSPRSCSTSRPSSPRSSSSCSSTPPTSPVRPPSTSCRSSSRPSRACPSGPTPSTCPRSPATSSSTTCRSATRPGRQSCTTSRSTSRPERRSRSSARPARASRRSRSSSRGSTTQLKARSPSTGTTCARSRSNRCAASSASCRRRRSCSRARCGRT